MTRFGAPPDQALELELLRVQRQIEAIYDLEPAPPVAAFVRVEPGPGREQLIVRQSADTLDVIVLLPESCAEALLSSAPTRDMDGYLGAVEGVSHFIHLAERARTRLPTTLLELELQAEVDKFAVLVHGSSGAPAALESAAELAQPAARGAPSQGLSIPQLSTRDLQELHRRLYENVRFLHSSSSERGQRYRLANDLAAKLWSYLIGQARSDLVRHTLRRFYRASQAEKIRMVRAA